MSSKGGLGGFLGGLLSGGRQSSKEVEDTGVQQGRSGTSTVSSSGGSSGAGGSAPAHIPVAQPAVAPSGAAGVLAAAGVSGGASPGASSSNSNTALQLQAGLGAGAQLLQMPTTLSIPFDGYSVSVELSPDDGTVASLGDASHLSTGAAYNLLAGLNSPAGASQLQAQIAQQMLAFATQQATLLQQALPFMMNLPPASVTTKLRELLTEVNAKPALEKFMKATGSAEPMAQRVW